VPHDLEYPGTDGVPDWESLYRAREDEVAPHRPVFTGDVFENVTAYGPDIVKTKSILLLQHPCALRSNGVDLHSRLMVAEVRPHRIIEDWRKHYAKMPLPELRPSLTSARRHQAAFFDEPYIISSAELVPEKRVACMSEVGVNLLLQRWVHHNSRAAIPTSTYQITSSPQYEEADLIEDWCEARAGDGLSAGEAAAEAMKWLREDAESGISRQKMLEEPQRRSTIRRQMRTELRQLGERG
jgi:hypothetical protein